MEFVDEMKQLFQEMENETMTVPGTSSSILDSEFCDPTWSFASPIRSSSSFLDVEDLIEGSFLTDTTIDFAWNEFDVLLQQSPPRSDISRWSFEDSYASPSSLENLASGMIAQGSSADELGQLVELVQAPTGVCTFDDFIQGLSQDSPSNVSNSLENENCRKRPSINNLSNDFVCKNLENWDYGTSSSGCTSIVSKIEPSDTLFSNLGLEQLLYESSSTTKRKRRRPSSDMMKPSDLHSFDKNLKSVHTRDSIEARIGDSCSMNVRNANLPVKRHETPLKPTKKKLKPGSRPVPKDRLQTYARLAELRELIPDGDKMSIDRLLQRTIKQLHFLQSVTENAKRLAETETLKDRKEHKFSNNAASGVTWACEIEDETMIFPLMVEDLSTPGQMCIEIVCQEQGFFLEIVDVIRGFGLNILRGGMEVHETKIHAHYIVEAEGNRFVSRHEIFSSLVQLLQLTDRSENDYLGTVGDGGISLLKNLHRSAFPATASLPDRIPCIGLL